MSTRSSWERTPNKDGGAYKAGKEAGKSGSSYSGKTDADGAWREARTWTEAQDFADGFRDGKDERKDEANRG